MTSLKKQIAEAIEGLIKRAKSGDTEAAYILLEDFATVVKAGGMPDQSILDYIAEGFNEILKKAKPEEALNIPNPTNTPPRLHTDLEDMAIAEKVIWEMRKNMKETGMAQLDKAKQAIAERTNKSISIVDRAYRTHKEAAKRIVDIRLRIPSNDE
jgi:hypothetical protein